MKKTNSRRQYFIAGMASLILVVVLSVVMFILADNGVFDIHPFRLFIIVMLGGGGIASLLLSAIAKDGTALTAGFFLLWVASLIIMIGNLVWYLIIIINFAILLIVALLYAIIFSKTALFEKTNEKEDFVPYMEKFNQEKQLEKEINDNKPLPKIKSFKDDDNK